MLKCSNVVPEDQVHLRINKKQIKVQKGMLMHYSAYFRELLSGFGTSCVYNIDGDKTTEEIIRRIVCWMQTKELKLCKFPATTFVQLFNIVTDLKISELEDKCEHYLADILVSAKGPEFYKAVKTHGNKIVYDITYNVIINEFDYLVKCGCFVRMELDDVRRILSDNMLVTNSELEVFQASMLWLHYKWSYRKKFSPVVMTCVKFSLLPKTFLVVLPIQIKVMLSEFPEIKDQLMEGFRYHVAVKIGKVHRYPHLMPTCRVKLPSEVPSSSQEFEEDQQTSSEMSRLVKKCDETSSSSSEEDEEEEEESSPRMSGGREYVKKSYVESQRRNYASVVIQSTFRGYQVRKEIAKQIQAATVIQQWYKKQQLLKNKSLAMTKKLSILVIGGISCGEKRFAPANKLLRFNPGLNWWREVGQAPQPFVYSAGVKVTDCIFITDKGLVIGKNNEEESVLQTTWSLNYATGKWKRCSDMIYPRAYHVLINYDDNLYCIGGKGSNGQILASVECMNPTANSWYELEPMPTARMSMAAAVYKKYIWTCGGLTTNAKSHAKNGITTTVECYCPSKNKWEIGPSLCIPRKGAALIKSQKLLFLVGGTTYRSHPPAEIYDVETNSWCIKQSLHCTRESSAAVPLDDRIYIIGGYSLADKSESKKVESYMPKFAFRIPMSCLPYPLTGLVAVAMDPVNSSL